MPAHAPLDFADLNRIQACAQNVVARERERERERERGWAFRGGGGGGEGGRAPPIVFSVSVSSAPNLCMCSFSSCES